ncbi:MAG: nucleotidyltransferase family protein [Gammaproteobacteria bacterium]
MRKRDFLRDQDLLLLNGYRLMRAYGWESSFVDAQGRVCIDLHQGITPPEFPFPLDLKRVWKRLQPLSICNVTVPHLSPEDMLLILCVQVSKDRWEDRTLLAKICDIAEFLRAHPGIDWGQVMDEATRLHAQRMLIFGLRLTEGILGTVFPQEVVHNLPANPSIHTLAAHAYSRPSCGAG